MKKAPHRRSGDRRPRRHRLRQHPGRRRATRGRGLRRAGRAARHRRRWSRRAARSIRAEGQHLGPRGRQDRASSTSRRATGSRRGKPFLRLEQQAFIAQRDQWAAQLRSVADGGAPGRRSPLADTAGQARTRPEPERARAIISPRAARGGAARRDLGPAGSSTRRGEAVSRRRRTSSRRRTTSPRRPSTRRSPAGSSSLNAKEGEVVVSGTMNNPGSVIGTIADLSEILAKVDVDETEIVNVRLGQAAVLKVDAIPGSEYNGKVVEVGSSGFNRANAAGRHLLQGQDPARRRRRGPAARHVGARRDPHRRPRQRAGRADPGGRRARAPRRGRQGGNGRQGRARSRSSSWSRAARRTSGRSTTGISDETHVELTSGAQAGEQVVTGPYRTLRDLKDGDAGARSARPPRTKDAEGAARSSRRRTRT